MWLCRLQLTLPWRPCVDLLLFVHRVVDLPPGLYALLRDPARRDTLEAAMDRAFVWTRPAWCPRSLPLFFLQEGDARRAAQQTSCDQEIAADGVSGLTGDRFRVLYHFTMDGPVDDPRLQTPTV